ncbi:glycosyltransferase [Burkholderiales bacterium JOSHI_001]|nr:glycosyltransferase [Burkholderiales bacterium JOSHI_001]
MSGGRLHIALLGQANSIHLQRWAVALHEHGRRVSVLSQQVDDALPLPAGVAFVPLPHRGFVGYFRNALALKRWLRAHQPDLLHAHYASGYGTTAMLARYRPTLLSVWGSDVYDFPFESRLKGWLLRRNLRAADALASTSLAMAQQVKRLWPQAGEIAITPFGVDVRRFAPATAPAGPLTIGTVKTLATKYGIDTLLRAFALIAPRSDARLLIVGDGPQRDELKALATNLGVAARVQWAGAVPHADVPGWLQRLNIYVAASRLDSESFGVAVVEAMACGVPVVVSDVGGLPEVVVPGHSGLVVPRDQPQALAEALLRLLDDDTLRRRLATAGRARAVAEYAWSTCVDRMLACQDAVVARHRLRGQRA